MEIKRDPDVEFYKLIPKGSRFSESSQVTVHYKKCKARKEAEKKAKKFAGQVKIYQTELLKAFDYKVKVDPKEECSEGENPKTRKVRTVETEEILFIKPLFILNNALPESRSDARTAILMLAADRDLLFKDADDAYQSIYQNKRIKRIEEENLIIPAVQSVFHCQQVEGCILLQTAINVLSAALSEAKDKKLTLRSWLFSETHVGITDDNREYYKWKNETDEEGYIKESPVDRELPASKTKLKKFVDQLRKCAGPGDIEMLDLEKCKKDFERLCPDVKDKETLI